MNSGGSNNVSLKYERYTSSGCWDIGKIGICGKNSIPSVYSWVYIKLYGSMCKVYIY